MKTIRIYGISIACALFAAVTPGYGQTADLNQTLSRSLVERVQIPLAFSTRDSAFALSLPQDEPATIFLQVTVGKNGKVKEKLTRVDANHLAGYVAPAFLAAVKDLRIDRALLGNLSGKDTSLTLAFPLEYQCVLDTMSKAMPEGDLANRIATPFYYTSARVGYIPTPASTKERAQDVGSSIASYPSLMKEEYLKAEPTRVWYYLAFLKDQPE